MIRALLSSRALALATVTMVISCHGAGLAFAQPPSRESDEKAIRQRAESFAEAYNAHDPAKIASLFTSDGEIVDPIGDMQQGRPAIENVFAAIFEAYPEASIAIEISSIRFLGSNVAQEDGVANVVHDPDAASEPNRYTAIHLKQSDGTWLMASARDLPDAVEPAAQALDQFAWIIGDWIDESPDSLVLTSYAWSENHNYILGQFTVRVAGKPVISCTQRIGWDPSEKVVRNWVFDDDGGFATGMWTRDGDRWIIKQTGVTRDGESTSATNTITQLGRDRFQWESRDRVIGGQASPDSEPVIVVRKPPEAGTKP